MRRGRKGALAALAVLYLFAIFAGFLAPYDPAAQARDLAFSPPSRQHVLGTDGFGRDQLSRLLYGARISLLAGPLGAAISIAGAVLLGGAAGFFGGWIDALIMRTGELFVAVPWFYLLFAVRMAMPLRVEPAQAFLMILALVALVGWARPARLIRGVVLSARTRDYVVAARSLGASNVHLLRRHVLPQLIGVTLTQAALLAPQYILAEATLSFFGLGVGEPVPSWGNMLAVLQRYDVLSSYWWMFIPAAALVAIVLLYSMLADPLHDGAGGR
ncbi:MAG: ABC transporter permease [Acidobacteria bacterium]|nr:MAG: ABC transporter permease [Acidobacteriota bacterium]